MLVKDCRSLFVYCMLVFLVSEALIVLWYTRYTKSAQLEKSNITDTKKCNIFDNFLNYLNAKECESDTIRGAYKSTLAIGEKMKSSKDKESILDRISSELGQYSDVLKSAVEHYLPKCTSKKALNKRTLRRKRPSNKESKSESTVDFAMLLGNLNGNKDNLKLKNKQTSIRCDQISVGNICVNIGTPTEDTAVDVFSDAMKATGCGDEEFECSSGQCIKSNLYCNGKADCKDGSDETLSCKVVECPPESYKCSYGACIDDKARCNGVKECLDNSDEANCKADTFDVVDSVRISAYDSNSCILPKHPENGKYLIAEGSQTSGTQPGAKVGKLTSISFLCNEHYVLNTDLTSFLCKGDNKWHPDGEFPRCIATCPPLVSSTVEAECKLDGASQDCTKRLLNGTIATLSCKAMHEHVGDVIPLNTIKCSEGSWDFSINQYGCHPVCGKKIVKGAQTLVVGGTLAIPGDYPWQVAVYRNDPEKSLICGGSIIHPNLVLSAAHCFANNTNGKLLDKNNYVIAAGKYYRPFNDKRDFLGNQYSSVKEIHIPKRYKGVVFNFESDIAVIVLEKPFTLTINVQPVCIDWNSNFKEQHLQKRYGVVCGWGYTKPGENQSIELKQLEVPYVDFQECYERVPENFRAYLTEDKMCAGYLNGHSVCQGDSGGPLVFKHHNRHYVQGIVSTAPAKDGACDSRQYSAYTKVSNHLKFIGKVMAMHR